MPLNPSKPSQTIFLSRSVSEEYERSTLTSAFLAISINSRQYSLNFGPFQQTIAPVRIERLGSGITRSGSIPIARPNPWHSGHAPNGLLKENNLGSGSS